jgi:hypothetical protein
MGRSPFLHYVISAMADKNSVDGPVGGVREIGENPRTPEYRNTGTAESKAQSTKDEETKNLQKTALASKVVNPFTRALVPPFIGRRRDFYISKIPSNLRNISSVNMYMEVFYIP